MIDRVGQTWEFKDGTIILVLASRASRWVTNDWVSISHDVLILHSSDEGIYPSESDVGSFSPDWSELSEKNWDDEHHCWRIA